MAVQVVAAAICGARRALTAGTGRIILSPRGSGISGVEPPVCPIVDMVCGSSGQAVPLSRIVMTEAAFEMHNTDMVAVCSGT